MPGHAFVHTVDSASSVEAEDLFNNMHRIVITNLVDLRTELLDALRGRGLLARHGIDRLEGIVDPAVVPRLLPAAQLLYLLCACTSRRVVRRLRLCLDIRQASTGRGAGGCMGGGSACANRRRREAGVSQRRALPSVVRGMRARRE